MSETATSEEKIGKIYVAFDNITKEHLDDIVENVEAFKKALNADPNHIQKIGPTNFSIVDPKLVRLKKTKEEKAETRRNYLNQYNKREKTIKAKREYLDKKENIEKRQKYAKLFTTKVGKERTRRIRCGVLRMVKFFHKDIYNKYYLSESKKVEEILRKKFPGLEEIMKKEQEEREQAKKELENKNNETKEDISNNDTTMNEDDIEEHENDYEEDDYEEDDLTDTTVDDSQVF